MSPSRLVLLAGLICASAQAQQATVYGLLDAGVERISNVGAGRSSLTRIATNSGALPSRFGLRGSEDLGDGLKAIYTLEMGVGPDTGAMLQGGRAWGRHAWLGLQGNWGQLTFGRQLTMLVHGTASADLFGPATMSVSALDSYLPNARADNSIAYRGTFNGLTVGGTYSFGRDTVAANSPSATGCAGENAADPRACREWSWMLKYDAKGWGVAAGEDRFNGGAGSWAAANLLSSSQSDSRRFVNGYAHRGAWKLGLGWIRRDNEGSATAPRSDLWHVGAAYAWSPQVTLDGTLAKLDFKHSANAATLGSLRATYAFSKRTAAYANVARITNDGAAAISVSAGAGGSSPLPGGSQNGVMLGLRHSF